jgi:hypothetical protein
MERAVGRCASCRPAPPARHRCGEERLDAPPGPGEWFDPSGTGISMPDRNIEADPEERSGSGKKTLQRKYLESRGRDPPAPPRLDFRVPVEPP